MRILLLAQYFYPEVGAPQVRLLAMAKELQRMGHEVQVLTALPNYPTGRILEGYRGCIWRNEVIDGVKVRRVWLVAATGQGIFRMLNFISFCASGLLGALGLFSFDLVFVSSPPYFLGVPGWILAKLYRARFVFYVADLWPDTIAELGMVRRESWLFRILEALERWIYRRADVVASSTQGIRTRIVEEKGVPSGKTLFFPNGVDTTLFTPEGPIEDTQGKAMFLYAGIHGYAQGLELLLQAADLLRDREDIVIWIVGSGPTKPMLIQKAQEMQLTNVRFFDPRPLEEVPPLLRACRASLVPLVNSPLFAVVRPSKLFPAWACAVPSLYCGFGEAAHLVASEGAGWVVPPEDPRALADCLIRITEASEEGRARGIRGRAYVEKHLGWPTVIGTWWAEMEQIFSGAGRGKDGPVGG